MKKKKTIISISMLSIFCIAVISSYALLSSNAAAKSEESEKLNDNKISELIMSLDGKPVREKVPNLRFSTLNGKKVFLKSYEGKTLFVTVWASWCKYCQKEAPYINTMVEKLKNNPDIAFIGLSVDDSIPAAKNFVKKYSLPYEVLHDPRGRTISTTVLKIQGTPTSFIISPNRELIGRFVGVHRWDKDETISKVRQLAQGL